MKRNKDIADCCEDIGDISLHDRQPHLALATTKKIIDKIDNSASYLIGKIVMI